MRIKRKQSGLSLMELLVVIAVMMVLMGVSIPAAKKLTESFQNTTSIRQLINAALSNARSIAIREQAYAGVRFQQDAEGKTYMIFIVHDAEATDRANGFRAVTGRKPMQLPEDIEINPSKFAIVFSPAGKLTIHNVWVRNKDGVGDDTSNDTIFNTQNNVDAGNAMFLQDYGNSESRMDFTLNGKYENINPYTGELVIEYLDK